MRKISLETSKDEIHDLHEIVESDGRRKKVTVDKNLLYRLLVDHHRMIAKLGPEVEDN